jgi:predicted Rossmann fold flavoprotein
MTSILDLIVIGGGPAGMITAGRAGSLGKKVLLLEKNPNVGKKLLITGGGRCNVTNTNTDLEGIYKKGGKYLHSTFSQFSIDQTLEFFHTRGMSTKVENNGRIFPTSNKSESVLNVLLTYLKESNVEIRCNSSVAEIRKENDVFQITLSNGEILQSKSCIVATGGLSHPETGSTGEGFRWLKGLGHKIIENDFALVPLSLSDQWAKDISGTTLDDVKVSVYCDDVKKFQNKGRILFTHFGISGPMILNLSKRIGSLINEGMVELRLDLFPTTDIGTLRTKLNDILKEESNKMIKNVLSYLIPQSLVPGVLEISNVNGDTHNHSLNRESRHRIIDTIKSIPLHVTSLMGADMAIISSGGVDINEVDFKTMESKVVKGLFLVGDVLDIDRPSGGYSLQLCWTTGYVAGSNA